MLHEDTPTASPAAEVAGVGDFRARRRERDRELLRDAAARVNGSPVYGGDAVELRDEGFHRDEHQGKTMEEAAGVEGFIPTEYDVTCPRCKRPTAARGHHVVTGRPLFVCWDYCAGLGVDPSPWPTPRASSWAQHDLADALEDRTDDRPSVLRMEGGCCVLYPGKVNEIHGEPESLKSLIAQHACVQEIIAGNHALVIDPEDSKRGWARRLQAMGVPNELILERFHYVQPKESIQRGWADIERLLVEYRPTLVVGDGVTELLGLEGLEDNAVQVAVFAARVPKRIAEYGPAVVMLDHVTKDKETRGRWAGGSGHKVALITGATYELESVEPFGRGRIGRSRLYLSKDRVGHISGWVQSGKRRLVADFHAVSAEVSDSGLLELRLVPATGADADDGKTKAPFRPTYLMERVSRSLEQHGAASYTATRERVKGKSMYMRDAVDALEAEGYIATDGKVYRSLRPYREAK